MNSRMIRSQGERARTPQTDWDGVLEDLFGMENDPVKSVETTYDSSSGIASDTTSYHPPSVGKMSTFKGDNSSMSSTDRRFSDSSYDRQFSDSSVDRPYIQKRPGEGKFPWAYTCKNSSRVARENRVNKTRSDSKTPEVTPETKTHHVIEHRVPPIHHPPHIPSNYEYHNLDSYIQPFQAKLNQLDLQDTEKLMLTSSKGKARLIRPSPFDLMTDDVIVKIFSNLPTDQLCRCSRVCQRWYRVVWDPLLWKRLKINDENVNVDKALKHLTKRLSYNTPTVCVILERINLNGCEHLTDKGLHYIARRCPELRTLEVQGCSNITNSALFEVVSYCVNLEYLDVTGCPCITCIRLTDSVLMQSSAYHLRQIYLRHLDMTDCYALEDEGLSSIAMFCSQLQFLYLRRCVRIGDKGIQAVASHCYCLRELSISDCRKVSDYGLSDLSKLNENLRYLSVAKCEKISDVGIIQISKHCKKLRYLNVRGCEAVSDDSLDTLARNCPRLKSLDVGKCDISDEGLQVLAHNCKHLRKLSVKSCDAVTDDGIKLIAYHCRHLQQLNIQDCHVTLDAYRTVKKYCKQCLIEHTNPGFY